jgi:hypothetical protein
MSQPALQVSNNFWRYKKLTEGLLSIGYWVGMRHAVGSPGRVEDPRRAEPPTTCTGMIPLFPMQVVINLFVAV